MLHYYHQMILIPRIDDFHCHLRDGDFLATTVPAHAQHCQRVLVMPNLKPAITSIEQMSAYRQRILNHMPDNNVFEPLMTLYLTDDFTPKLIEAASKHPHILAVKLYPRGATTHAGEGVSDLSNLYPVFAAMEAFDLPLAIHGEVTDHNIDIFDRERVFIERHLQVLMRDFPKLRIVLEHITSAFAVDFVRAANHPLAATITAHHLLINRNDLLVGGIKPHLYCLPIAKRQRDQKALIRAATSGNPRFFLGSDSAPHTRNSKESACGCAGIYTGDQLLAYYATAFAYHDALDKLPEFASHFGADFYGLPRNAALLQLVEEETLIPNSIVFGDEEVIPFMAGAHLPWRVTKA